MTTSAMNFFTGKYFLEVEEWVVEMRGLIPFSLTLLIYSSRVKPHRSTAMFEGPTAAESRQMVKTILVEKVEELQGCKAETLFAFRSITRLPEGLVKALPDLIDELVSEGKLIKVVYTVPELYRRNRSFLLPAGTGTKIIGGNE